LLSAHGLSARLEAYHEHNAAAAGARALEALEGGLVVALVSDAGTPLVSDPGEGLVRLAIEAGCRVFPIPGASALLAGLAGAGLPTARFLFAGFPPPKSKQRRETFLELASVPATLVFFESGPRLAESLTDMAAIFGGRAAVVGRELTKMFEEFRRGDLATLAAGAALGDPPKGEMVVMVGPPEVRETLSEAEIEAGGADEDLRAALARLPIGQAAQEIAALTGASRRALYQRALTLKNA
jgi:16S rRNA (cytidine1402-2'-O)-methyltransferase